VYWPYVDNVWRPKGNKDTRQRDNVVVQHFECYLAFKPAEATVTAKYNKTMNKEARCNASMRMETLPSGDVTLFRNRSHDTELCSLNDLDMKRRNAGLRIKGEELLARNIAPATALAALQGVGQDLSMKQLKDAGGEHLTRADLKNWIRAFKKSLPDSRMHDHLLPWETQASNADDYLDENDWEHDYFEIERERRLRKKKDDKESRYSYLPLDEDDLKDEVLFDDSDDGDDNGGSVTITEEVL
jgi:hypothetical protein